MEYNTSPSLKHKLKQTLCLSCCYRSYSLQSSSSSSSNGDTNKPGLIRSSSIWIKSKAQEFNSANIFGRTNTHRRHTTADFKYDPLSYALNFEDECGGDDAINTNFSSRLPMTPVAETRSSVMISREISSIG